MCLREKKTTLTKKNHELWLDEDHSVLFLLLNKTSNGFSNY